jgi:hypothetical protein
MQYVIQQIILSDVNKGLANKWYAKHTVQKQTNLFILFFN